MLKKLLVLLVISASLCLLPVLSHAADFEVGRFLTAKNVVDREPAEETASFAMDDVNVYCFLEAMNTAEATTATLDWIYEGESVATVDLKIGQSGRWRTWSTKNVTGRAGDWEIQLKSADGTVMKTIKFTVK